MLKTTKPIIALTYFIFILLNALVSEAALQKGVVAPSFPALEKALKSKMSILYFFTTNSKSSIEGLENLKKEYDTYKNAGIKIYGISKSDTKELDRYLKEHPLPFSLIRDDGKIFRDYDVHFIFPTTYILSPGGRVSDIIQGGGPASYQFIKTLAQRSFQLQNLGLAKRLYSKVLKENPTDLPAQTGMGNTFLAEGRFGRAEAAFTEIVRRAPVLGKEGLAVVYLKKGENNKALAISEEIQKEDSENGLPYLIKGNIMSGLGNQDDALASYNQAIESKLRYDWQQAEALSKAAEIYSDLGEYNKAEAFFTQAVRQNPFSSEILTNQGVLYGKTGQFKKMRASFLEASAVNSEKINPQLISLISQLVQEGIQKNKENQEKIQKSIDDVLKEMPIGNIAFNTPTNMNINDSALVHLVLSVTKSLKELNKFVEGEGEIEEESIRVATVMEARLTGPGFDIQEITRETQVVSQNEINPWKWEIRPKKRGLQNLHLTLSALLTVDGKLTYKSLRVFDRVIEVQVTPLQASKDLFQANWQWLLASIILPLAGWALKKNKPTA